MKTLVLGDIHGRSIWKKIIELEQPDRTIFLGDYVASFNVPAHEQIKNLEDILAYASVHPETILLRGNHDIQHLGYSWAQCSGFDHTVYAWMREHEDEFLQATRWIHIENMPRPTIFSHAGISDTWLENNELKLEKINELEPCETFGFNGFWGDMYGTSPQQPCTWIRPETLAKHAIDGYDQVVGHTRVKIIKDMQEGFGSLRERDIHIWLCDALERYNDGDPVYLIIDDGNFDVKIIKEV